MGRIVICVAKCIFNPTGGGGTRIIYKLGEALSKKGHSIRFVCARFSDSRPNEAISNMEILRYGGRYTYFLLAPQVVRRLGQQADVVIDVDLVGFPQFTPLYINKRKVISVIFHIHGLQVFMREAGPFLGTALGATERLLIPRLYSKVEKVTFSESTKREMLSYGFDEPIHVFQEGIEVHRFSPGAKANDPIVLYVGRLKKYKGVQDAIKAMSIVVKSAPDTELVVVGRGSYEGCLRQLARELGLQRNIRFAGYVSFEEKLRLLQKASVLVMPSYKEGWATPVIEASACGTPAIVADIPGVRDSVLNGQTGYTYPVGDIATLAERIIDMIKSGRDFSRDCTRWSKLFRWETTESEFVNFVENFIR